MNTTQVNIISNFVGRFIPAVLGIVFVPIYLRYVSVEMYGIIGFFSTIQAFLLLLDGGVTPTLNREVARLSALPGKAQDSRDMARTLEILCWGSAILVCLIALIASPFAAEYWLRSETVSTETVHQALMLMSFALTFQWAITFYTGGMFGLQEQKLYNAINVVSALLRAVGAWIVLAYVSPTITGFLGWQLVVAVINCVLLVVCFWVKLPASADRPRFKLPILRGVWRYAAGLAGTGLVVLILAQTDKLILSKMLSLEDFGYYSLALTLAGAGIGLIVGSIQTAYFPRFSQLVAQDRIDELKEVYHRACQVMSFFLVPVVTVLAFFSYEILLVWTGSQMIAEKTYLLLTLVAIGTGLNGLMHLPYYAQLAFGITKIGFWQNVIAIVFLVPFMVYATFRWGAVGGALSWVILNFSYTIFGLWAMHRLILTGELKRWYLEDTIKPIVGTVAILLLIRSLVSLTNAPTHYLVLAVGSAFVLAAVISILLLPNIRDSFAGYLRKLSA